MTHSIQTIAQENHNLAQQKKNHGYLKETLEVLQNELKNKKQQLIQSITIDAEQQAVLASLDMFMKNVLIFLYS